MRLSQARRGTQGFAGLANFPSLWLLNISESQFTDIDIEYVLGMRQLNHLDCMFTKITDAGLCRAMQNRSISQIIADGTSTSEPVRRQALFPQMRR